MIIQAINYQIFSGSIEIFDNLRQLISFYSKIFLLVDENTNKFCLSIIEEFLPKNIHKIQIQSGEIYKNLDTCQIIWKELTNNKADRKSILINLGGGVIGDMGGFCASTYKRGIDFINIPTTLLSQVDASVGGKLGIDFLGLKNQIGVFCNPKAVFIYPEFIDTLSHKEKMSGFAEIIKHSLINNFEYWREIQDFNNLNLESIINQSIIIKRDIVNLDPEEKNIRKKLNFGHTIGHAIESFSLENDNEPLSHGHSVAIGMICESYISNKLNNLSDIELKIITSYIKSIYPFYKVSLNKFSDLFLLMKNDKKNDNELINFTLLNKIGSSDFNKYAEYNIIYESLNYYSDI